MDKSTYDMLYDIDDKELLKHLEILDKPQAATLGGLWDYINQLRDALEQRDVVRGPSGPLRVYTVPAEILSMKSKFSLFRVKRVLFLINRVALSMNNRMALI
jgi:hypothetical protein